MVSKPEVLAPVGDWEMLSTAINAKADSIYFGIKGINMRAGAKNFDIDDIPKIAKQCHNGNVKAYLCINTIVYEDELEKVKIILQKAKDAKIDAIICWDLSVLSMAKDLNLEIHLSTQASSSNSLAIKQYKNLGATRVVLARECTIEDIKKIKDNVGIEVETFVHGAMCVAVSGRCFMSQSLYGKSANRGECIQPCRRSYDITDPETGKELQLDNRYVMSPKDLCAIRLVDKLIDAGVDCLKIEGRNRSPEYVKVTVESYKKAIKLHFEGKLDKENKDNLENNLKKVYNRGFSNGFFMGRPIEDWTDSYGSKATKVKRYAGKVVNYFKNPKVAEIKLEASDIIKGDTLLITGPTTGCIETQADSLQIEDEEVKEAKKGSSVGIKIDTLLRKNDKVYVLEDRQ